MKNYKIEILLNNGLTYEINVCNKLNFLIGDSATGKSVLSNMVNSTIIKASINGESIIGRIGRIKGLDYGLMLAGLKDADLALLIIDEDIATINALKSNKINKFIKNKIVIVISRDLSLVGSVSVLGVTTGVQNYYKLDYINGKNISSPYFEFKQIDNYENVATEDSKSGYYFMKQLCDNVIPLSGKEKIKYLTSTKIDLLLVDLCALNQMVYILNELYIKYNIGVVDTYSFEWIVLNTNLFKNDIPTDVLDKYPEVIVNIERYLVDFLDMTSNKKYNIKYFKGSLDFINWLFKDGKNNLLRGTKFEYLLNTKTDHIDTLTVSLAERARMLNKLMLDKE